MYEPLVWLHLLQRVCEAGYAKDLAAVRFLQRVVHRPRHHAHAASPPGGHVLLCGGRLVDQHRRDADKKPEEIFQEERVEHVDKDGDALQEARESKY